jgi:hypothetical protein
MKKPLFILPSFTSFFVLLSLVSVPESAQAMDEPDQPSQRKSPQKRDLDDKGKEEEVAFDPKRVKKERADDELFGALAFNGFNDLEALQPEDPAQQEAAAITSAAPAQPKPLTVIEIMKSRMITNEELLNFITRAKKGDKESINNLAEFCYGALTRGLYNSDTERTYYELLRWVSPAAENNNPYAQSFLGWQYATGKMPGRINVDNDKMAIDLFKKSERQCSLSRGYLICLSAQERTHGLIDPKVYRTAEVERILRRSLQLNGFILEDIKLSLLYLGSKKSVALEEEVKSLKQELAELKASLSHILAWAKNCI